MKTEKEQQILSCMADVLNQNGFRAELMQDGEHPTLLRIEAMKQGKVQKDVVIECCFISLALPTETTGLLQFFVTLFEKAPEIYRVQIEKACAYCNSFCALGTFQYLQESGQIYLKYNTLLDSTPELETVVTYFADTLSLLLASVTRFIDGLAAAAFSGMPLEAIINQDLFPQM